MNAENQEHVEKVAQNFDATQFMAVQKDTIAALHVIANRIQVGMLEEEAYELAKGILSDLGFAKNWHRPYVRFGENTSLMYGQRSKPEVRLQQNDLFFLDIGPVKNGYEGDAGDTFLMGHDAVKQKCMDDARALFQDVQEYWKQSQITGTKLYEYASSQAQKMGWLLNLDWKGHRIGDFPHQVYFKGALAELDFSPSSGLWILEIHLCDQERRFGAFYEDVLSS